MHLAQRRFGIWALGTLNPIRPTPQEPMCAFRVELEASGLDGFQHFEL